MALLPTLLAIAIGVGLGVYWGGTPANLAGWRPVGAGIGAGGVALLLLVDVVPVGGGFMALLRIAAIGAICAFAVLNVRVGGMILVVVGTGLNLLVTLLNWGTPVSASALISAGLIDADEVELVSLHGGRIIADGATLGFLGGVIPLPWGQVISIGDLIALFGVVLVTASVCRRYEVPGGPSSRARRSLGRSGPADYRSALDALGRGPAPRRGPGLHPSRMQRERSSRPAPRGERRATPPGRQPGTRKRPPGSGTR